jgi:hypothetical protein
MPLCEWLAPDKMMYTRKLFAKQVPVGGGPKGERGKCPMAILHFRCKERRRTVRVMLRIPLKVHGISSEGETFAAETMTHTISLHGASVELEYPVQLGDILTVENELTRQQVEGKVVTLRKTREGKMHVGLEFTNSDVNFWHMAFPVPGAKPLRRLAPNAKATEEQRAEVGG